MRLNTIKPAAGSKRDSKRVGRGAASGWGKTGGRGHNGQKARSGGYHKIGFEGGQMPIYRRLPKRGFHSLNGDTVARIRTSELNKIKGEIVDLVALREARLVGSLAQSAKVFLSGEVTKKVVLRGISVTPGARRGIEAAGGSIEE